MRQRIEKIVRLFKVTRTMILGASSMSRCARST
jgi:hypothetical protein